MARFEPRSASMGTDMLPTSHHCSQQFILARVSDENFKLENFRNSEKGNGPYTEWIGRQIPPRPTNGFSPILGFFVHRKLIKTPCKQSYHRGNPSTSCQLLFGSIFFFGKPAATAPLEQHWNKFDLTIMAAYVYRLNLRGQLTIVLQYHCDLKNCFD